MFQRAAITTGHQDRQTAGQDTVALAQVRAEMLLIGFMILAFTMLLQSHANGLILLLEKLPMMAQLIGQGIRSALVS